MRSLYIAKIWPEPLSTAAGRRVLDVLATLQLRGEVHLASTAQRTVFSDDLTQRGVTCHDITVNDDGFDDWLTALAPDCVVFDRFMTEEQFGWRVAQHCPSAIRVLDTCDLHCLREARAKQCRQGGELDLFNDVALREVAALMRCDLGLMISSYERQLLEQSFAIAPDYLHVTPFMLTPLRQATLSPSFAERQHLVMIGNFHHEPNWDAVRWLHGHWSQWRQYFPAGTEVHIYGAYDSHKVWQLHQPETGFVIKGRASDAIETLSRYRVNLAYLRFGAGIKGKVADAWLAGTPSVASAIAAEGMHDGQDWGSAICDDPQDWIAEVSRLYRDEAAWQSAVRQGRKVAEHCHNTAQQRHALLSRLEAIMDDIDRHRHRHLWGRLLAQQQFRASEYFSRWITIKNQRDKADYSSSANASSR